MPEQETIERAREDALEGKSPSTQAGEFVREEFHHVREGKHGARSPQQAIAIGLSKARRAGVKLRASRRASSKVKRQARRDAAKGRRGNKTVSRRRSRATLGALKREGRGAASTRAVRAFLRGAQSRPYPRSFNRFIGPPESRAGTKAYTGRRPQNTNSRPRHDAPAKPSAYDAFDRRPKTGAHLANASSALKNW